MEHATRTSRLLLLGVVVIVGLNLRPFMTGVGPLATSVAAETGLGLQGIALLTLVPMLLMGAFAFIGPWLQTKFGARRSIIVALGILALGSFLRIFPSAGWAMVGTAALLGVGAAIVQAVFPGIIKRHFPKHVGIVTGLYSSMLMGGGALGALAAPAIAALSGNWRLGLGWLAVLALAALALAAFCLPKESLTRNGANRASAFLRRPRTWLLMASFGLVNGGYSTAVAWLAASYQAQGWSSAASGSLLAVMAVGQAASAILMPTLAGRMEDRRPWLLLTLIIQALAFAGLAFSPGVAPMALALMLGVGLGGCFSLSMVVALEHLHDPAQAGALSALMQGGGFLLAALPPWIVAILHDLTGSFTVGWLLHLGCVAIVLVLTTRLAPGSYAGAMAGVAEHSPQSLEEAQPAA